MPAPEPVEEICKKFAEIFIDQLKVTDRRDRAMITLRTRDIAISSVSPKMNGTSSEVPMLTRIQSKDSHNGKALLSHYEQAAVQDHRAMATHQALPSMLASRG